MTFVKGVVTNPAGRPRKNETMKDALLRALKRANRDEIAVAVVDQAAKGNIEAIKFVFDRIDGKVKDEIAVEQSGHIKVIVEYSDPANPEAASGPDSYQEGYDSV